MMDLYIASLLFSQELSWMPGLLKAGGLWYIGHSVFRIFS